MSDITRNHLDITAGERKKLRAANIRIREIHRHTVKELQSVLQVSKIRAMELFALSEFQSLPSIGIRFAYDLISMGYYSLKQLKGKDGAKLTDQLEIQTGAWIDPCVEDQFRLVVHYAQHPESHKNWWDFTTERKAFRGKNGYPASRPKKPWFELPQYQLHHLPAAKKEETKKDLHDRLKKAVSLMKKNLSKTLTLKELAEASHLSSYHFLRCFRSAYSKTPFQYLTHLRLKLACKLLRETGLPVNTIISKCGFENDSSFIRLFKKEFRITPVSYRNEFGLYARKRGEQAGE
ncbi:MAG: helix-hairpin-helix domain-containing protein [Bacteroidota bacterium]|nr:helix-hairpin-helix domain-containing protein [Bacteroidota bacterium]